MREYYHDSVEEAQEAARDLPLTTTGDEAAEREARKIVAYCGIVFDEVLWFAYQAWRCRFFVDNPFR